MWWWLLHCTYCVKAQSNQPISHELLSNFNNCISHPNTCARALQLSDGQQFLYIYTCNNKDKRSEFTPFRSGRSLPSKCAISGVLELNVSRTQSWEAHQVLYYSVVEDLESRYRNGQNEWIHEWMNEWMNGWIYIYIYIYQSINQSINQSVSQSISQSINQSINQSTNQYSFFEGMIS